MKILSKLVLKNVELSQIRGGTTYWVNGTKGQNGGDTFYDVGLFGGGGFGYEALLLYGNIRLKKCGAYITK
jgi:hypothetical protein